MPRSTACSAPTTISPSIASGGASFDPEDVAAVEALLIEAGAPPGFAAFLAGEGGAEHDRLRSEAEASGVFGVPTFVFDGELFWGGDRIGLLRERLDEKGAPRCSRERLGALGLAFRRGRASRSMRSCSVFTSPRCLLARSLSSRLARRNASFTANCGSAKRSSACGV